MSHWWLVDSYPTDGVYHATCKKCQAETVFKNDLGTPDYNMWLPKSKDVALDRLNMMQSEMHQLMSGMYHD